MGPVIWALWSLKLVEVGQRGGGVGAPVPRLVGGGGNVEDGEGGQWEGINYCLVKERFLLSRIGIPQCLQVSFQF